MLADLLARRIPALCQRPDGQLTPAAAPPAALVCGSFNPLHVGHRQLAALAANRFGGVAYEIGIANADKPMLDEAETRRRLRQFEWLAPVWLTREPTFAGKARLFPGVTFVLGADTAERVVAARYYADIAAAFATIRERGCRFLVAGRATPDGCYVGGDAVPIPPDLADLFDAIPEGEFRYDVSSTALRRA